MNGGLWQALSLLVLVLYNISYSRLWKCLLFLVVVVERVEELGTVTYHVSMLVEEVPWLKVLRDVSFFLEIL